MKKWRAADFCSNKDKYNEKGDWIAILKFFKAFSHDDEQ